MSELASKQSIYITLQRGEDCISHCFRGVDDIAYEMQVSALLCSMICFT